MAKSAPPVTLRRHTLDVMAVVSNLADALRGPLAGVVAPKFVEMLRGAAFFHDLGKAASGFQAAVTYSGGGTAPRWGYRHEALSAAILLATGVTTLYETSMFAAVISHHRTLDSEELTNCTGSGIPPAIFANTSRRTWDKKIAELQPWWEWVRRFVVEAETAGWVPRLPNSLPVDQTELPDLYVANEQLEADMRAVCGLRRSTIPWLLARGLLMAADHLASAGLTGPLILLPSSAVRPAVGFQQRSSTSCGSVLLEAPTGSGKTEAALHWALANRVGGERIFYILPYQASINKMGERLRKLFGEEAVGIIHHRAALQEFSRHFEPGNDNYDEAAKAARIRIDQTRQFYRPLKVLTPYQLLKVMFGCRYFEIGLAEMLGALVIFDEIHAYDPHTAALIELAVERLAALKVRFMFMTATFPPFLKERLSNAAGGCPNIRAEKDNPRDTSLLTTARHKLYMHDRSLESFTEQIVVDSGAGTVLVVCNRVAQAQALYTALQGRCPSVALLHSRFISRDRVTKERELTAFPATDDVLRQQIPRASVLVTTQVVEVSLNVSYDTCYSEIAPVDALLQRFGRVNRMNQHTAPVPVHVACVFEATSVGFVYSLDRISTTRTSAPQGAETTNGVALYPQVERDWVLDTYRDGYSVQERAKYETARKAFAETIDNLRPYYSGDDRDFYDLFDNYEVVPVRFAAAYKDAVANKRFYVAAQFVASLPQSAFHQMKEWTEWDGRNHVYYLNRRYDDELGLLNEPEPDAGYNTAVFESQCL